MKKKLWPWLLLSFLVVIIDQLSKYWVIMHCQPDEPVKILPFLNFTLAYNRGAAFSFLTNADGWQVWFFSVIAIVISIAIYVWLTHLNEEEKLLSCGLSLVLGGAVGNLIDRIVHGVVTDFIDFHIHNWHYATFNLADSAVFIGAVLIGIDMIFVKR